MLLGDRDRCGGRLYGEHWRERGREKVAIATDGINKRSPRGHFKFGSGMSRCVGFEERKSDAPNGMNGSRRAMLTKEVTRRERKGRTESVHRSRKKYPCAAPAGPAV